MTQASNELGRACADCRTQFQPDWQFCAHCAIRLLTACPRCAVPLPPAGSQRCGHCGFPLASIEVRHDAAHIRTVVRD